MQFFPSRRIAGSALVLSGVALGASVVGVSSAATGSSAAVTPQKTVTASIITRSPGTLAPGTKVSSSRLGQRVFTDAKHGFALANVSQAQYPAATTNGGKSWKTVGPALHINAAQAPLAVINIGVSSRKTIYAFGGGQAIDTTSNGGKQWYRALFNGQTMAVVRGQKGHLVAFVDQANSTTSSSGVTFQYVSSDGGRTWRYTTTVGGG